MIGDIKETRYSDAFLKDTAVKNRFKAYYRASMAEIDLINKAYGNDTVDAIPYPKHVIFGHTHRPIPWNDNHLTTQISLSTVL